MPYKACSLYALQWAPAEPGLIAHFTMPKRLGDGMKWLILYVILSRVPSLAQMRAVDLDEKVRKIIDAGPPTWLFDAFDNLTKDTHPRTQAACREARLAMGW